MQPQKMTISQFAKKAGVGVETIRFYHRQGLLPLPKAVKTSFREYEKCHFEQLYFIRQAQLAGFRLAEIKTLLSFDPIKQRASILSMTKKQLLKLNEQIKALEKVSDKLQSLVEHCEHEKEGRYCPIVKYFMDIDKDKCL